MISQHWPDVIRDVEWCLSLLPNLLHGYAVREFDQCETVRKIYVEHALIILLAT